MIKIGGSFGAFAHLLPAAIANFRATQPDIQIESHTAASPVLEQELLDSKIDLAVLTRPRYVPSLVYEPCGREKVIAVVGSRHPFAKTGTLSPAGLARVPLLIRSRLSGTVSKVEARLREFEKQGIAPRIVMYCDSHSTLLASVKKGAGVGFIRSGCLVGNALKNDVRVLRTPWLDLFYDSYAVYPKEKPMTAAALEFLQLLRKDFTKRINAPMQKRQFRLRKQKRV
jgi:DNA-binding transcriptional LysR family regulator